MNGKDAETTGIEITLPHLHSRPRALGSLVTSLPMLITTQAQL